MREPGKLRTTAVALGGLALFGVAALVVAYCWGRSVYASYLTNGIIGPAGVLMLSRRIVAEFLVCGAFALTFWRAGRIARAVVLAGVGIFALINFSQYYSAATSNDVLTPAVLRMAGLHEYGITSGLLLRGGTVVVLSIAAAWAGLASLGVAKLAGRARLAPVALALVAAAGLAAPFARPWDVQLRKRFGLEPRAPVSAFAVAVANLARTPAPRPRAPLDAADLALAASYGIPLRPEETIPIRRERAWSDPPPFPSTGRATPPNIVVIFAESLSAGLLDPYRSSPTGMTPNISAMAERSMRVDEYFNHAFPTVRGVRGQLCSIFSAYGHEDWQDAPVKLVSAKLRCLPHILAEEGYRSAYITPSFRGEVYADAQALDFGFSDLYFRDRINTTLLGEDASKRNEMPGDRELFRALVAYLQRSDRSAPVFVALSTIGTHAGWDSPPGGVRWGDGSNNVRNTFHYLDDSFGEFWSWFVASPYRDDTIVVLTGDHSVWPHDAVRMALGPGSDPHEVDRMGLIVYDPFHALPPTYRAATSSIDLAPSLLQLAGVGNRRNAFQGVSMFTERGAFRGGPGHGEWTEILRWEDGRPVVESVTPESCEAPDRRATHVCSLLRVILYLRTLEIDNRIWRE